MTSTKQKFRCEWINASGNKKTREVKDPVALQLALAMVNNHRKLHKLSIKQVSLRIYRENTPLAEVIFPIEDYCTKQEKHVLVSMNLN